MDLLWVEDLDLFGAETQSAADELYQDVYHVIEQDVGSNPDDPTRGLGLANALSDTLQPGLTTLADEMLMKDDRIKVATATLTTDDSGGPAATVNAMQITIEPNDDLLEQLDITIPIGTSTQPAA